MVTVKPIVSAEYYLNKVALERHDYYIGNGEGPGRWTGSYAQQLELSGEVTAEQFKALCEAIPKHPETGEPLKWRPNTKVHGWDVCFSAPKSVSALWALLTPEEQEQLRAGEAIAAREGTAFLETYACWARFGKAGSESVPAIGFVVAEFAHRLTREGDPGLHLHDVIPNIVQAMDGRTSSIDGTMLRRYRWAADAIYQAALRAELTRRLGVSWVERNGVWEVEGIPVELCQLWSKRRAQILDKLDEWGTSGGRAAQAAALATRRRKTGTEEPEGLDARLRAEARDQLGIDLDDLRGIILDRDRVAEVQAGLPDEAIIERLVGPEGLTEKASSFGFRDIVAAIGPHVIADAPDGPTAAERILTLAMKARADARVIPLLEPARRTSGEVLKLRDEDGKITRTVSVRHEQRYTTVDLITVETELIERAEARQHEHIVVVPDYLIEQALAEFPGLDEWQVGMVRRILGSGHGVDVVIGKAGAGKSYACQAVARGLELAGVPVIGCAPTAQAAAELRKAAGIDAWTLDRLLTDVQHGNCHIPSGALVLLDEAGMVSTRNRLALQRLADEAGAKVAQIGDHRQIPSVDVGGSHGALAERLGATTLDGNHRFRLPQLREAAELIRDGQAPKGIALLRSLGMVYEHLDPAQVHAQILHDWQELRAQGREVAITAFERATVATLNQLARRHLVNCGEVAAKGRSYRHPTTGEKIVLATGDRIRLEQNYGDLPQPDGTPVTVYNGMRGTITAASRRGILVRLDPDHSPADGRTTITLPAWYTSAHVDYAYATTMDRTQGATVDDSLVFVSGNTPNERAYVALSRGRYSNRIYARANTDWEHAIAQSRTHTFAIHQHPDPDRLAEHHARTLTHHRTTQARRTECEAWRREHEYATGRTDEGRGCGIAM